MRITSCFIIGFMLIFNPHAKGQDTNNTRDKAYLEETNQEKLESLSEQFKKQEEAELQRARELARGLNIPLRQVLSDGTVIEVSGIDPTGLIEYQMTHNLDAAKTTNTNQVWPSNSQGLNLTGKGYDIGIWDDGEVYSNHQDLTGRVTQKDNPNAIRDHSTHVAGTLIGSDNNNQAKGMAYEADLNAYDWVSDNSEMTTEAAAGLLVSNHSYGNVAGWEYSRAQSAWFWYGNTQISQKEDYRFGFYTSGARSWDQIANNAPHYLIVKSAGNDRNDDGPSGNNAHFVRNSSNNWIRSTKSRNDDGSYESISSKATAKNILTVGAVKDLTSAHTQPSDVDMTSFSSWGPTDDGRIKPDLVANGRSVKSCGTDNTSDYDRKSGTSMSSPNAAGSMLLLQEHYFNTNNQQMRAATLKGLAIHTADAAGSGQGPDYKFGWGLLNTAAATKHITNASGGDFILEKSLKNNDTFIFTVKANAKDSLSATLCWNDPAGNPPSPQLDPSTKMLVNDLDLRIYKNKQNKVYKPYVMDPANPGSQATTGDNSRDNVEQVFVKNPQTGIYTVEVTHKGTLKNRQAQDFSLIISGEDDGCKPPVDLSVDKVYQTKAKLSWSSFISQCNATVKNWKIQWGKPGFQIGQGDSTSVNQKNGTITGLTSNASYEAYIAEVRANNGRTDYIGPVQFSTSPKAVKLPYNEGFESFNGSYNGLASIAGPRNARWFYRSSTPEGRLQFSGNGIQASDGNQAATLDVSANNNLVENNLILTLNMTNYNNNDPIFLEFEHREYDEENHPNDSIWIRGSKQDSWIGLYDLDANSSNNYQKAGAFNISKTLKQAGQSYTRHFQVRFGQEDNNTLAGQNSDGRSFDEISIGRKDLALKGIPEPSNLCNLSTDEKVTVVLKNSGLDTVPANTQFQLVYTLDNTQKTGQVTLQDSIHPGDTFHYRSTKTFDLSAGGGPYNLTVKAQWSADQVSNNGSYSRQINPKPNPDVNLNVKDPCEGRTVIFTEDVTLNGATVTSYQWNLGDGSTGQGQSVIHSYSQTGQQEVDLGIVTASGCNKSASKTIEVKTVPTADVKTDQNCGLSDVKLTGFFREDTIDGKNYNWQLGNGETKSGKQVSGSYEEADNYTVQLFAEADNGCADTHQQLVPVGPQPVAQFSTHQGCVGKPLSINNQSKNIQDPENNYSWDLDDGQESSKQEPAPVYEQAGTKTLTLTASNTFDTLVCRSQENKQVKVEKPVSAEFSKVSDQMGEITLSPEHQNAHQYLWKFADGDTSTAVEPTVPYDSNGNYRIELITSTEAGCKDTAKQSIMVETVGLDDHANASSLQVYPNPVNKGDALAIEYELNNPRQVQLGLFNTKGEPIKILKPNGQMVGKQKLRIVIPETISPGVYALKLATSNNVYLKRIVVLE